MVPQVAFLVASLLSSVGVHAVATKGNTTTAWRRCGTVAALEAVQAAEANLSAQSQTALAKTSMNVASTSGSAATTLKVYVHVVQAGSTYEEGNVPYVSSNSPWN